MGRFLLVGRGSTVPRHKSTDDGQSFEELRRVNRLREDAERRSWSVEDHTFRRNSHAIGPFYIDPAE
ncbi:hypothetical protein [Acuticoccus kandeliae]|uniref:hypothetical protein n=1 Tax=Acuticoccus kandeliae TaxID=2073160 RepID=UPI000D3E73E5|nr:hypothetical protein [Acuticoccus kandeliae]